MPRVTLRQGRPRLLAPFGRLVEMGWPAMTVNEATALRHDVDAFAAAAAPRGFRLVTSIYQAEAQVLPRVIRLMERHRNSSQLIMPVTCAAHGVIVCMSGADGRPDLDTLCAFQFTGRQGMIYGPGVWHHPILALRTPAEFLVQSWQDGTADDCDIAPITPMMVAQERDEAWEDDG